MTVHSYFSGIEGFGLGFHRAGFDIQVACEIDKKPQSIIRRHFQNAKIIGDIKHARGTEYGKPDVIVGGFPCQDLSIAGLRSGLAGNRSGMFFELARVIDEARPRIFVLENVPGLLSSKQGRDLETVLRALVECGYRLAWRVLDSQYFRVAQRRRRVFIVGSLGDGRAAKILFEHEGLQRGTEPSRQSRQVAPSLVASGVGVGRTGNTRTESEFLIASFEMKGSRVEAHADRSVTLRSMSHGSSHSNGGSHAAVAFGVGVDDLGYSLRANPSHSGDKGDGGINTTMVVQQGFRVRRLMPVECERLQGFPDGWTEWGTDEHGSKVIHADSSRYKMLGNAVTVNVAEWIARRILEACP